MQFLKCPLESNWKRQSTPIDCQILSSWGLENFKAENKQPDTKICYSLFFSSIFLDLKQLVLIVLRLEELWIIRNMVTLNLWWVLKHLAAAVCLCVTPANWSEPWLFDCVPLVGAFWIILDAVIWRIASCIIICCNSLSTKSVFQFLVNEIPTILFVYDKTIVSRNQCLHEVYGDILLIWRVALCDI